MMTGTSATTFAPAATTTRGMLMTVLARQAGESEEYADSAKIFCKLAEGKISEAYTYVMNSTLEDVALFRAVAEETE